MVYLAELNEHNICVGVKLAKSIINDGKHIQIENPDFDFYVWRKYENGQWSEDKYLPPEPPQQETVEEKLARLEQQLQETTVIQYEALATIFEEILALREELNGGA